MEQFIHTLEDSDRCSSEDERIEQPIPIKFEDRFLKGIGLSVWQNSFDEHSQWTEFAKQKKYFGQQHLIDTYKRSADFWNMYAYDIELAHKAGATSFRFSFEWARFEPVEGVLEQETVTRYHQILDCLESYGMVPMCTLHHFTHPLWFEKKGGFLNSANIPVFLKYVETMFKLYGHRIRLWGTFNEPTVFAFVGYIMGLWAPGRTLGFVEAGEVLLNLLKAHVLAYKLIKSMEGGTNALVGIVHQHILFKPKTSVFYVKSMCSWMSYWFGTKTILKFFQEGRFEWKAPFRGKVLQYDDPTAPSCLDWWGINYYSRPLIDWNFKMCGGHDEPLADNDFRMHPDGMYESIKEASVMGVPIYITETGIADRGDSLRGRMIQEYYFQVLRAVNDGYDVRGIYFWTLMDNIEWHEGFRHKFGLYEFHPEQPRCPKVPIQLKPGSQALVILHKTWPDTHKEIKAFAIEQTSLARTKTEDMSALIWTEKNKHKKKKTHLSHIFAAKNSQKKSPLQQLNHASSSPGMISPTEADVLLMPSCPSTPGQLTETSSAPVIFKRSLTAPNIGDALFTS